MQFKCNIVVSQQWLWLMLVLITDSVRSEWLMLMYWMWFWKHDVGCLHWNRCRLERFWVFWCLPLYGHESLVWILICSLVFFSLPVLTLFLLLWFSLSLCVVCSVESGCKCLLNSDQQYGVSQRWEPVFWESPDTCHLHHHHHTQLNPGEQRQRHHR